MENLCPAHSGINAEIASLKCVDKKHAAALGDIHEDIDKLKTEKVSFRLFWLLVMVLTTVMLTMGGITVSTHTKVTRLTVQMENVRTLLTSERGTFP